MINLLSNFWVRLAVSIAITLLTVTLCTWLILQIPLPHKERPAVDYEGILESGASNG